MTVSDASPPLKTEMLPGSRVKPTAVVPECIVALFFKTVLLMTWGTNEA